MLALFRWKQTIADPVAYRTFAGATSGATNATLTVLAPAVFTSTTSTTMSAKARFFVAAAVVTPSFTSGVDLNTPAVRFYTASNNPNPGNAAATPTLRFTSSGGLTLMSGGNAGAAPPTLYMKAPGNTKFLVTPGDSNATFLTIFNKRPGGTKFAALPGNAAAAPALIFTGKSSS